MLEKILNVALGYVGYLEKKSNSNLEDKTANAGTKNYTIFAKLYHEYTGENYQGQAWCAMFVSVCMVLAVGFAQAKELLGGKLFSYCPYGMKRFKDKGRLHTTPKKGDIVFFLTNGVAKHTGFVYKVSGNTIYTIEGNTSGASGVIPNGGGVCKKSYTVNGNMRFGRPNYKESTKAEPKYNSTAWVKELQAAIGVTVDGIAGPKTLAACPALKHGSKGAAVKLMQQRIGEEFKISVSGGYDGDFGSGTLAAVKALQKAYDLKVDGEVGPKTWAVLLDGKEEVKEPVKVENVKVDSAKSKDKALAGKYVVTASALNMRAGAGTDKAIIRTLKKGEKVTCYGYYTDVAGTKWLLVSINGSKGFVSSKYLRKC